MSLTFLCPKHQTRGFHACAVPEPCPTRSSSIASELRKQSQGPERFAPAFAVRAVTNAIDKFQNTYKNWGEQKGGTWRKYAHSMGQMALSRIHPDDEVLAQLPPATSSVSVGKSLSSPAGTSGRSWKPPAARRHRSATSHYPAGNTSYAS